MDCERKGSQQSRPGRFLMITSLLLSGRVHAPPKLSYGEISRLVGVGRDDGMLTVWMNATKRSTSS